MNFDFFLPISEPVITETYEKGQIGYSLIRKAEEDFQQAKVCFIGIEDARFGVACESIRRSLYQLFQVKNFPNIYDLGNIHIDEDFFWKREEFAQIVAECMEREILLCFLGGGQEFLFELQQAYAAAKKYVNVGLVHSKFQLVDNQEDAIDEQNYLFRLCSASPSSYSIWHKLAIRPIWSIRRRFSSSKR